MLAESIYYTDQFLFGCAQVQDSEDDSSLTALVCPGRCMSVTYLVLVCCCRQLKGNDFRLYTTVQAPTPLKQLGVRRPLFSQQNCHGIFQFHPTPPSPNPALSDLRFLGKDKIRLLRISWLIRGDCRADSKFLDIQRINCSKVDFSYSCTDCFRFLLTKASRGRNH